MKKIMVVVVLLLFATSMWGEQWKAETKSDALTGKSYVSFTLAGKYLTPPSKNPDTPPTIMLRCDPAPHMRLSGKLLAGFIIVNTVLDLENGGRSTVQYRLDDGKLHQTGTMNYSTDYQALVVDNLLLGNMLWGHWMTHKPNSSPQVRKFVIAVQEHLGGQIVMQFDMPDATQVSSSCGAEYR
jgi:hypothetical protein